MESNIEPSNFRMVIIVFGILFMIVGFVIFVTKTYTWIRNAGSIGIINIEQPKFYAIIGSTFILSGSLLIGFYNLTESVNQSKFIK